MQFRHFLRTPNPSEQWGASLSGLLVAERQTTTARRLTGLVKRMSLPFGWRKVVSPGAELWENAGVAAGYTYLGQFIAHDCVQTSVPTGALAAGDGLAMSRRNKLLALDSLYGGGPDGSPMIFAPVDANHPMRNMFALSRASLSTTEERECPFLDIGRARLHRGNSTYANGYSNALVADARNDVHAVAAQMTVLFKLLHNRVLERVVANTGRKAGPSADIAQYRAYYVTRFLCERIFRLIVRKDYLKTLLHPAVVERYDRAVPAFVDEQSAETLPVEFAQALRFGHAMVRPKYVMNDTRPEGEDLIDMLLTTSGSRPWRTPVDETWIVAWDRFFAMGQTAPNWSRRIGPEFSEGLLAPDVFGPIDATRCLGLPYRDLVNGAGSNMWSINCLAREVCNRMPELSSQSKLLSSPAYRRKKIAAWLGKYRAATSLTDDDVSALSDDPPLFVYVLFEAASEMDGRQLGVLGSIILAETLYRALANREFPDLGPLEQHGCSHEDLARIVFGSAEMGPAITRSSPRIGSMMELVRFLRANWQVPLPHLPRTEHIADTVH